MKNIYSVLVSILEKLLPIAGRFSSKLNLFVSGRKNVFSNLEQVFGEKDQVIWFHAASLGEYEQGVPVMKAVKKSFPNHKILLTFFSPSGYEVKKNNSLAHHTTYLPLDTKRNAHKFVELTNPVMAIFVKYEIWPNYLTELANNGTKVLLISGMFRKDQIFFRSYAGFMRDALEKFDWFFVQDEISEQLLGSIGASNVTRSGDTRFDRVSHQLEQDNSLDFVTAFKADKLCLVCGSTWPEEEKMLTDYINSSKDDMKFIIAPHVIKPQQIHGLRENIEKKNLLYSEKEGHELENYQVLIMDSIGLLGKIYSYADIAYVGGGMGTLGLHNILEPSAFGVPVIIGKNYDKFPEAVKLYKMAGLFSVRNSKELEEILNKLIHDDIFRKRTGMISGYFIQNNTGATKKIMSYVSQRL